MQLGRQHEEDGADGGDSGDALPHHMPLLFRHSHHIEVEITIFTKMNIARPIGNPAES